MASGGEILNPEDDPNLDDETLLNWYKSMVQINVMDTILYDAQRQVGPACHSLPALK